MLTFAIGFALVAEVHLARKDFDACLKNLFFALNAVQALQNLEHSRQLTDAMIDEGVRVEQMKLDLDEIENLISIFKMDCMPDAQVFTWMREKYNAIQPIWMSELLGVPLETLEIVVKLIGATKTETAQPQN